MRSKQENGLFSESQKQSSSFSDMLSETLKFKDVEREKDIEGQKKLMEEVEVQYNANDCPLCGKKISVCGGPYQNYRWDMRDMVRFYEDMKNPFGSFFGTSKENKDVASFMTWMDKYIARGEILYTVAGTSRDPMELISVDVPDRAQYSQEMLRQKEERKRKRRGSFPR